MMTEPSQDRLHRNQLTTTTEESLVSTHKSVLAFLKTSALLDRSKRRLHDLQKRRIFLASEIARARSQEAVVQQNLDIPFTDNTANNPSKFLKDAVAGLNSLFSSYRDDDDEDEDDDDERPIPQKNLASAMQRIRKKRKLTAAHRLGGITAAVPQMDPEILSFRFDICLDGVYVACYHAFFDLVVATTSTTQKECDEAKTPKVASVAVTQSTVSPPSSKLYLRLSQHTIPSAIPFLEELCKDTLGGSLFAVGDLNDKESWRTVKFEDSLRSWAARTYKACWCWEERKRTWNFLTQLSCEPTNNFFSGHLHFSSLTTTASNAYDRISFDLSKRWCRSSGIVIEAWEIHLLHDNWVHGLPTNVNVNPKPRQSNCVDPEFAQMIQKAFLDHPVEQALQVVAAVGADSADSIE